mmetsp:Transcript_18987/g.31120  ORF Transcript_18987/g.31120 Transcript_18987/m.31120 type:complete len:776 (-) Transcript_18987:111-2438(-)|eukprot:CAMPEP_0184654682 /NCGR_PEP_ID=MMETSP0308-20130426/12346_1 /TAXON_ID=38269 /ORGANISM="Gloeochaete witrockiana, Strain SAG 46.84" /LENGTH=775 /DNA_ID=CAMNT_0027090781 /DNA_START=198 /DNA_END=2525 /DNA_ORIENTATION=+
MDKYRRFEDVEEPPEEERASSARREPEDVELEVIRTEIDERATRLAGRSLSLGSISSSPAPSPRPGVASLRDGEDTIMSSPGPGHTPPVSFRASTDKRPPPTAFSLPTKEKKPLDEKVLPVRPEKSKDPKGSFLKLIAPDGGWIFLASLLALIAACVDIFYPYLIGLVYRHLMEAIMTADVTASERWSFQKVLEPIMILFACQWLAMTSNKLIVALCKRRLCTRVRVRLFANLICQDLEFFDRSKVGEMVSRLMKDVTMLEGFLIESPLQILAASFKTVGCAVITIILSWRLALVNLLLVPVFGILALIFGRLSKDVGKHYTSVVAAVSQAGTELLGSVRTIQAFGREKDAELKFNTKVNDENSMRYKTGNVQIAWRSTEDLFVKILQVASLWYGAVLVVQGQLDVEYIIVFQMYARLLQSAISSLFLNGSRIFQLNEMLRPLHGLLFMVPKLFRDGITPGPSFNRGLAVQDLDFAYPTSKSFVLENVSFSVPCRSVVGVVGRSGSGKSTLLQLMLRFYDPINGTIRLDGHDLRLVDLKWLRERYGYVAQEPVTLNATVAENIAFGAREVDFKSRELWELVLWASKTAQAHQFISALPNGYKTQLGAGGVHLSGGQKQRVAIARALVRRPDILVLDEATSCLDPMTERQLMNNLASLQTSENSPYQPKIMFIIAHRLSLVRNADLILVVDGGRIVQAGNHATLASQPGLYASLIAPPRPQSMSPEPNRPLQDNGAGATTGGSALGPLNPPASGNSSTAGPPVNQADGLKFILRYS